MKSATHMVLTTASACIFGRTSTADKTSMYQLLIRDYFITRPARLSVLCTFRFNLITV